MTVQKKINQRPREKLNFNTQKNEFLIKIANFTHAYCLYKTKKTINN